MTFSIVGRSADGRSLGVAVASKFLAAGAYVPAAAADAGALATQANVNLELKTRGLAMLRDGVGAADLLERFFADDPDRAHRQAGVVEGEADRVDREADGARAVDLPLIGDAEAGDRGLCRERRHVRVLTGAMRSFSSALPAAAAAFLVPVAGRIPRGPAWQRRAREGQLP